LNRKLAFHCVLIALPALALCALGAYFLCDKAPKIIRAQKAVVTRQYREVAEAMLRDPLAATACGPRQKGWRQTSKIGKSIPWGHAPGKGGEIVWVGADAANVAQVIVPVPEMPNVSRWLFVGVPAVLALFVAMTGLGIWLFVRYSKERDDFLSATAHDLTTPLVAMSRLIGRDDDYALTMNERMLRLVRNVTDFLKLGGKRREPERERFSVGGAFFEAYHVFADDFAEEASGEVKVVGDVGLEVVADKLLTVQILWNLLGNDLKYAAPHGPVTVRITERGAFVDIAFEDVGPGMTPRQRRHAFDRYYRARTALESGKGGFGIGLCTAREFARAMGGGLSVAANAPRGCVFTLTLPLAPERF